MNWQGYGASVVGTSHQATGTPCQDAFLLRLCGPVVIAAVADGLGSASRSADGSRLAVSAAVEAVEQALATTTPLTGNHWRVTVQSAFAAARDALEQQAAAAEQPLRDFATTLLVAVVTPGVLATGHLGDGAIVARRSTGELETVSLPQRGEFANETTPVTAPGALERVAYRVLETPVTGLALFTDGLQNLCITSATGEPFTPFFEPFFATFTPPFDRDRLSGQLAQFLGSDRVCQRTDDDKTLVVIGRLPRAVVLPG